MRDFVIVKRVLVGKWIKAHLSIHPLICYSLLTYLGLSILFPAAMGFAQEMPEIQGSTFYQQLRKDEFLQTMISKEKYLLQIVQSIHLELNERKREGVDLFDLGIRELVPPEEIMIEEYAQELTEIIQLLDDIELLERKAKQKVNLQILEALSQLKERIYNIIDSGQVPEDQKLSGFDLNINHDDSESHAEREEAEAFSQLTEDMEAKDLFEQWKYNRILDYKVKLTQHKLMQKKFIETGNSVQVERMFRRDLTKALENYSDGDLAVANLQFWDIMKTYTQYTLFDDVLYYVSETSFGLNYLDDAIEGYQSILTQYPDSPFSAKSLVKLIFIRFIYGQSDRVTQLYQRLTSREDQLEGDTFSMVSYLVGHAQFDAGKYSTAMKSLGNVTPQSDYFYPSLYLSAACYSNMGQEDLATSLHGRF